MRDDPFVRRTFTVDGRDVICRFFRPEEDEGSFFCRYEIDWAEGPRCRRIGGVDEVQALLLAMSVAHTDLLLARENDGRAISWLDDRDLGLPILDGVHDLAPDNRF